MPSKPAGVAQSDGSGAVSDVHDVAPAVPVEMNSPVSSSCDPMNPATTHGPDDEQPTRAGNQAPETPLGAGSWRAVQLPPLSATSIPSVLWG